jgi:hypothetical protein
MNKRSGNERARYSVPINYKRFAGLAQEAALKATEEKRAI